MSLEFDLLGAFESHDAREIQRVLDRGMSPTALVKGKTPIIWLMEMYTRSAQFATCLRVMLKAGATFDDPLLECLLLDDAERLQQMLGNPSPVLARRFHLECTYTSLYGASPLHICAEYNSCNCAQLLIAAGHEIDARADIDSNGFGGHTPLFHTVNSNQNYCRPMMELLANAGASLDVQLKGLIWARGFDWETTFLDVTPLSYAQCGLYPQVHRGEEAVYHNLAFLYEKKYGEKLPINNVPNKYLR